MAKFEVLEVVDGDTFKIKGNWQVGIRIGNVVRPTGYDTPEKGETGYESTKQKLKTLILNKKVDIRTVKAIDKWRRLVADVYFNNVNLATYFTEYKI